MSDGPSSPYRSGMASGLGVVLAAGLILAVVDIIHTGGAALPLLGLWAILAAPTAVGVGLVLGAGAATWGDGWVRGFFRKLRERPDLDRTIAGVVIAAALVAGVLAFGVAKLANGLIGEVQRKDTGAKLLMIVVVALIPIVALGALPLYRVTRRIASIIPAVGPLSRVVSLAIAAVVVVAGVGAYFVRGLDYQALDLGSLIMPALLPVIAIVIALAFYGPISGVRERIPARGLVAAIALVIAAVMPIVGLFRDPSDEVKSAVIDRSYVGNRMITLIRKFIDRDHDGKSPFFGGPDCDDHDPNRYLRGPDGSCLEGGPTQIDDHHVPVVDAGVAIDAPATTLTGGQNLLVIFIDTLRYDRLGIAGYERDGKKLTPRLDQFAKQSVVFRKAYAQAPNTPRSVPSFFTSCYPSQIKWDNVFEDYAKVLDDNDTLFEVFKAGGFLTTGETSHFYFCDHTRYPNTCGNVVNTLLKPMVTNITQGTDEWDNTDAKDIPGSNTDVAGPRIATKAIAKLHELADGKKKFAMLVHLFDPHSTYMEHPGFTYKEHSLPEKYDYEIAFDDELIGKILDAVDTTKLADNTTVVVLADHGEGFGLHRISGQQDFFHGETLYQSVLHVPLMFRVPGAKPCMRDDVVQLIDLAPTAAALFGVKPSPKWTGRSLVPALECGALPPQPAFAELLPARAWNHEAKSMISADGTRHVYYRISDSTWEIYDVDNDADERNNIVKSDPDATKLEKELASWISDSLPKGCR